VEWLKKPKPNPSDSFYEDTWREVCRTRFFHSLYALCELARQEKPDWPVDRWRVALRVWSEKGLAQRSWRYTASLVKTMPDEVLEEIVHDFTWWLMKLSESIERHEDILLNLCKRILNLQIEPSALSNPVTTAINHPIGHVTQALINLWFTRKPKDNDLLPEDIKPLFTNLCKIEIERFCHGRVILGSILTQLFRVDNQWTVLKMLPLLDWQKNPKEVKDIWQGFLWKTRPYQPLLLAIKAQFIQTVDHYDKLGEHGKKMYAIILTDMALERIDGFTDEEFRNVFKRLHIE
jgi:hypothetical protein